MKKGAAAGLFTILVLTMVPAQATTGSIDYKWDGRYRTSCRPEAWRQPANWPEPRPYQVIRTFNTGRKVSMTSQGNRYDMGSPGRRISGERNISARAHTEHHLKASVQNDWGLVKRFVGTYRWDYRYANYWAVYRCRGIRISS